MKKVLAMMVVFAALALVAAPVSAAPGTLYEQEGTADDGPAGIDASGQAPPGSNGASNWKYQYGGGTWSGVYAGDNGWETTEDTGDMNIDVEADIEMFMTQTVSNNKIYFHIGNIYDAMADPANDLTAYVDGTVTYNNGMYVGISFADGGGAPIKDPADFEQVGGNFTGVVLDGMQSDNDTWRAQDNQMDIRFLMNWFDGSGWNVPVAYGSGSHGTVTHTLWWLVAGGATGTFNYQIEVRLLPEVDQPDGDYYLDPVVVAAPIL